MSGRGSSSEWSSRRGQVVDAIRSGRMTPKEVMAHLGIPAAVVGGWIRAEMLRRTAPPNSLPRHARESDELLVRVTSATHCAERSSSLYSLRNEYLC